MRYDPSQAQVPKLALWSQCRHLVCFKLCYRTPKCFDLCRTVRQMDFYSFDRTSTFVSSSPPLPYRYLTNGFRWQQMRIRSFWINIQETDVSYQGGIIGSKEWIQCIRRNMGKTFRTNTDSFEPRMQMTLAGSGWTDRPKKRLTKVPFQGCDVQFYSFAPKTGSCWLPNKKKWDAGLLNNDLKNWKHT